MATRQQRFCKFLFRSGSDATVVSITGTQCPCMIYRSSEYPSYSQEWHRLYPSADDCGGSGLINSTTTSTAIKATFTTGIQSFATFMTNEIKVEIGEKQDWDMLMYGQCKASDASFLDVSGYTEQDDYVTYNGNNYIIRHTFDVEYGGDVGQISLLKRKTS